MAFSVSEFRTHFSKHSEFAKTSKFDVLISPPRKLPMAASASDLRFQCETTELPGYTINTVDNRYYAIASPVATFPTFNEISLTFVCAGDFWEKKFFDRWMNLVVPFNNYNPNYKDNYTSPKIEINQYSDVADINSQPVAIYKASIFGAFPTSIAPMSVNWGDDAVHRLVVTFKYEYWTTKDLEDYAIGDPTWPTQKPPMQARPATGAEQVVSKPSPPKPASSQPAAPKVQPGKTSTTSSSPWWKVW
jgi:hypothetical protein